MCTRKARNEAWPGQSLGWCAAPKRDCFAGGSRQLRCACPSEKMAKKTPTAWEVRGVLLPRCDTISSHRSAAFDGRNARLFRSLRHLGRRRCASWRTKLQPLDGTLPGLGHVSSGRDQGHLPLALFPSHWTARRCVPAPVRLALAAMATVCHRDADEGLQQAGSVHSSNHLILSARAHD
jgi:hypothetical protein